MLWNFPIEPLEERYSAQWARWWPRELDRLGVAHEGILGRPYTARIERGQFLDTIGTHYWKATQLAAFIDRIDEVQDGDWILLHDAWNPMLESLAYIRDTSGPRFNIAGIFHAGTYDPHDYLSQACLGSWAGNVEKGWLRALDRVFVATDFHRRLLTAARGPSNICVTGLPFYTHEFEHRRAAERESIVVFPHRLAPEKQPFEFEAIADRYRRCYPGEAESVTWVRTKDACPTKDTYYSLLGRAKVAVSCALQETWGIAMLEAAALGCAVVYPNRLSYPETMPPMYGYDTIGQAVAAIHHALHSASPQPYSDPRWSEAIANMCRSMEIL